jgi:hypothetical protein
MLEFLVSNYAEENRALAREMEGGLNSLYRVNPFAECDLLAVLFRSRTQANWRN